jgi:acetyltransferase
MALVAERFDGDGGEREILGVGRLSKVHGLNEAEFAIVISDLWQHQGLGTYFLKQLIKIAKDEKLDHLSARIVPENEAMQEVCEKLGFELGRSADGAMVEAELKL